MSAHPPARWEWVWSKTFSMFIYKWIAAINVIILLSITPICVKWFLLLMLWTQFQTGPILKLGVKGLMSCFIIVGITCIKKLSHFLRIIYSMLCKAMSQLGRLTEVMCLTIRPWLMQHFSQGPMYWTTWHALISVLKVIFQIIFISW